MAINMYQWDPLNLSSQPTSQECLCRLQREIDIIKRTPTPNMMFLHEMDLTRMHFLIWGPDGTPYQGGFFYFVLRCPADYPNNPPRVKLVTPAGPSQSAWFHPSIERSGKVCLPILGTSSGSPVWNQNMTIPTVLDFIFGLFNADPYSCAPDYTTRKAAGELPQYHEYLRYQTLSVAVLGMLTGSSPAFPVPPHFQMIMETTFLQFYAQYCNNAQTGQRISSNIKKWTMVPEKESKFQYPELQTKLTSLYNALLVKHRGKCAPVQRMNVDP